MSFTWTWVTPWHREAKRVVTDERGERVVKVTTCCCARPAHTRRTCSLVAGNKTPCRCFCHSEKLK